MFFWGGGVNVKVEIKNYANAVVRVFKMKKIRNKIQRTRSRWEISIIEEWFSKKYQVRFIEVHKNHKKNYITLNFQTGEQIT